MWRTQAIVDLLLGDLGGLPRGNTESLARARRKGAWVVAFDWLAILVLVAFQERGESQWPLGAGEQTLLTVGILAVAVHSGYRLAQVHKLRTIERLVAELEKRRGE